MNIDELLHPETKLVSIDIAAEMERRMGEARTYLERSVWFDKVKNLAVDLHAAATAPCAKLR